MTKGDKAAKAMGKVRGVLKGPVRGYTGIFRTLAEEHGEVDAWMMRVAGSNDPDVKREVFAQIRRELLAHAEAEEREFYAVLLLHSGTRGLAEHGADEHHKMQRLIEELSVLDPQEPGWSERFDTLKGRVEEHVKEEEHDLFPLAKDVLTADEVKALDERFAAAKKAHLKRLTPPA